MEKSNVQAGTRGLYTQDIGPHKAEEVHQNLGSRDTQIYEQKAVERRQKKMRKKEANHVENSSNE